MILGEEMSLWVRTRWRFSDVASASTGSGFPLMPSCSNPGKFWSAENSFAAASTLIERAGCGLGCAGLSASVTLRKGDGGVFEVSVDETLRFSKKEMGRFPSDAEIVAALS